MALKRLTMQQSFTSFHTKFFWELNQQTNIQPIRSCIIDEQYTSLLVVIGCVASLQTITSADCILILWWRDAKDGLVVGYPSKQIVVFTVAAVHRRAGGYGTDRNPRQRCRLSAGWLSTLEPRRSTTDRRPGGRAASAAGGRDADVDGDGFACVTYM